MKPKVEEKAKGIKFKGVSIDTMDRNQLLEVAVYLAESLKSETKEKNRINNMFSALIAKMTRRKK